jgi:hypothetical protein
MEAELTNCFEFLEKRYYKTEATFASSFHTRQAAMNALCRATDIAKSGKWKDLFPQFKFSTPVHKSENPILDIASEAIMEYMEAEIDVPYSQLKAVLQDAEWIMKRLTEAIDYIPYLKTALLMGSVERETCIQPLHDIDILVVVTRLPNISQTYYGCSL